jgi:hypothetical protein
MQLQANVIIAELELINKECEKFRLHSTYDDCSDRDTADVTELMTKMAAAIERFSPHQSRYLKDLHSITTTYPPGNGRAIPMLQGVLRSLLRDIAGGRLKNFSELLHAEMFGDLIDMSEHLLSEGYKDAAAVLGGGVIEQHLRNLCTNSGISTIQNSHPKKADQMNSELSSASVYSKSDQKSVTAWLGLRNKAAHGEYSKSLSSG